MQAAAEPILQPPMLVTADTLLAALQAQAVAQTQALQQFMQHQTEALQVHTQQVEAQHLARQAETSNQFQQAMQAQRDQARAEALAAEARLDAIRAEMNSNAAAQQQHADAQTAAVTAAADAVTAQQTAIDTTANAAAVTANAVATQVSAPRTTNVTTMQPPLPPSLMGIDTLDTSEPDPIKLSILWRGLEHAAFKTSSQDVLQLARSCSQGQGAVSLCGSYCSAQVCHNHRA